MATTGKTGADAIFQSFSHICRVITRYRTKLDAVVTAAEGAGAITSTQATAARDFISTASTVCSVFELIAGYSGF